LLSALTSAWSAGTAKRTGVSLTVLLILAWSMSGVGNRGGATSASQPYLDILRALDVPSVAGGGRFSTDGGGSPATTAGAVSRGWRVLLPRTWSGGSGAHVAGEAPSVIKLSAEVARAAAGGDPDAMHAAALIDLRWGQRTVQAIDRAVGRLDAVGRITGWTAPVLADLAAAELIRFEVTADARSLFRAIERAEHALEVDSTCLGARYSLVLALHHFGMEGEARRESEAYLERDSASIWAATIREISRRSAAPPKRPEPQPGDDSVSVAAYAAQDRQAARLLGWDVVLARWSERALAGDAQSAERALRLAELLGLGLRARAADGTLDEAVRVIRRRSGDPAAYRTVIVAHRHYAVGQDFYKAGDYERAAEEFRQALAVPGIPSPLDHLARIFRASSLVHSGRAAAGERLVRTVLASADTARYPALVGRAYSSLGTSLGRRGQEDAAMEALAAGEHFFARAGEPEGAAGMVSMRAELAFIRGDVRQGYGLSRWTLAMLRHHRHSTWRHNILYVLAAEGGADGFTRAAARAQDESVEAAAGTGRALDLAEALLARARLRIVAGRRDGLEADVRAARALLETLPRGSGRAYTEADLRLAEGLSLLADRPTEAVSLIDSSVSFFTRIGSVARLAPALAIRAEAHAAAGHSAAALADLARAVAIFDDRAARMGSTPERAMLYREARRVLDRVVMLRVADGQAREALADLERTRLSIAQGRMRDEADAQLRTRPGETGVVYARVADTLLVWTVSDTTVRLTRLTVDSARLVRAIERAQVLLELRSAEALSRPVLAELHELLVRPVVAHLGGHKRSLVIVADGEFATVPFAALFDVERERYLVEDHQLRFVSTLREAQAPALGMLVTDRALIIGDPAFDPTAHPGLARLAAAAQEARTLGDVYPRRALLTGVDARRTTIARELLDATIVHFAGHAVFDDERPERSHLVLAAEGDSAHLAATDIAQLPLGRTRLVVLSACRTIGAPRDAVSGLAGLAGAFRAAGVQGVVGSAWRVDDDLTNPLMTAFHRRYADTNNGPAALRAAQLEMLRSGSHRLSAPAAWAAFRYIGS
jgi:CHAT domain-containing protein